MIASKYTIRVGIGRSLKHLPSFDKALIAAGVGNYNLVRLSSILPAGAQRVDDIDLQEGSLLPTAYASVTSSTAGETIVSVIGVGIPKDKSHVGVIMEFSCKGMKEYGASTETAMYILKEMIQEAFLIRNWDLEEIICDGTEAVVGEGEYCTTFACIAEW